MRNVDSKITCLQNFGRVTQIYATAQIKMNEKINCNALIVLFVLKLFCSWGYFQIGTNKTRSSTK